MASLLSRSTTPRPVSSAGGGGRGPQSGVDYFGSVGQRATASMAPRDTGRPTGPEPGAQSLDSIDTASPNALRMVVEPSEPGVKREGDNRGIAGLAPGVSPLASPGDVAKGMKLAGLVPGLQPFGFIGTLIDAANRDQQSMDKTNERDLSGFVGAPAGIAGASPLGIAAAKTTYTTAKRMLDDDPANDPTVRTIAPALVDAAIAQYAPDDARRAAALMSMVRPPAEDDPRRVNVNLQAPPQDAPAPTLGVPAAPAQDPNGGTGPNGPTSFDNPSFNPDDPNTVSAMDSVNSFTNTWNSRENSGGGGTVGGADGRGTNNSAHGGDATARRGGMAIPSGFSRPRGYAAGGGVDMGVPSGQPDEQSVQANVQRMLRDRGATQRLLALPLQLMNSGELTPDEVLTMGRVAEAAMYNPQLYPQLRQFVAQQGMTPLPPAYDPSVITNIMVIAKALQAQMPATPPGQVPPTGQAQVEQPVPGFGNGGFIRGPGNGTSDSIGTVNEQSGAPVKVATDEYIIPAHVVRAKGREFFDNLLRRYDPSQNGG